MKQHIVAIIAIAIFCFTRAPSTVQAADAVSDPAGQIAGGMSITADQRATILKAYFHAFKSPLENDADTFVQEADANNLDWKLVAAISGVESTFGENIPAGSYNAWGWGIPTGAQDGVHFTSWKDGISQVSQGLKKNYFDHGAQNIYDVGWIYAANGDSWGSHVQFFMDKIGAFTPADPLFLSVNL